VTLLERLQAAVETASQAEALAQRAAAGESIDEVAAQVRDLRLRLVRATVRRTALKAYATGVTDWPDPAKSSAALAPFRAAVQEKSTGGKAEFRQLVLALDKMVEGAEQAVSVAVKLCCKSLRDDARPLDDLGGIEGFAGPAIAVKRSVEDLLARDWLRADDDTFARLLEERAEVQKRCDSLVRADVPKAVRAFFRAARGGGAPLGMLTDEVIAWLDKNGQRDKVRLVIK
jgi:hypothetical protein